MTQTTHKKSKQTRIIIGALLAWLLLYLFFDIPNRLFYQEKGWNIPTDPREKAAYDFAHSLQIPPNSPQGGFKYLKVNEHFDHGKAVGKDNPPIIETIIPQVPQPQAFNFVWARFKSLFWLDEPVRVQYFKHLCDTEAGEYIYKTVDKVEGIYQMRPMPKRSEALMKDRYGFEDPADWTYQFNPPEDFLELPGFSFYESMQSPEQIADATWRKDWLIETQDNPRGNNYWHYYNYIQDKQPLKVKSIIEPTARYAYTWRGQSSPQDRRYGIAGGEMFVIDRQANEVLAYRRSFAIAKNYPSGINWEFAYFCPGSLFYAGQKTRDVDKTYFPDSFILQSLHTKNYISN